MLAEGVLLRASVRIASRSGSGGEQSGAVVEAYANYKRTRLSRTMGRHARQQFSANL
jgi:hypothetical protein